MAFTVPESIFPPFFNALQCNKFGIHVCKYGILLGGLSGFILSACRRLRRHLQEDVIRDLCSSAAALQELEAEFNQLTEDREILRRVMPSGNSKVGALFVSSKGSQIALKHEHSFKPASFLFLSLG